MNLPHLGRSIRSLSFVAPLAALTLVACVDPFVAFDEVPTVEGDAGADAGVGGSGTSVAGSGVGAGASSAGQATGAQPGSAGSNPATGVAGSTTIIVPNAGGADPGVEPSVGGEGPVGSGEPAPQPQGVSELIDDVEGAFPHLPEQGGRNGGWYTTHDATYGQVSPARAQLLQPARGTSRFAAEMSGGGFTDWGAQLGVSLRSPSAGYDASAFCGVRFMAKGSGSGWSLLISDRQSVPEGGVCDPNAEGNEAACYQFVGKPFEAKPEWQEVVVPFNELRLLSHPERQRALDTSAIYDILFNFYHHDGAAFQLLVDDLSFMKETAAGCR